MKKKRLQIGGEILRDGWEICGPRPGGQVQQIGELTDLSRFADESFSEILACQVVQRLDHRTELDAALREWSRVLEPGGRVCISVPDLDSLARLFLDRERLSAKDRFQVMRIMFGGHVQPRDWHRVGLNEEFLASYLIAAGYVNVRRVESFGPLAGDDLLVDTSALEFRGVPVGLNVIADKPAD